MTDIRYRSCTRCNGTGRNAEAPDPTTSCWGCWGEPDRIPANIPTVLPPKDEFRDTGNIPRELLRELADSFGYIVIREDRPGTWSEYNLGTGGIWSSTDYGRAWEATDDAILANDVYEKIATQGAQWCKFYDRESRKKAELIVIRLHRHGYVPMAVLGNVNVSAADTMWLPPTYTDELLNSNPHV